MASRTLSNLIVNLLFDSGGAERGIARFSAAIEKMGERIVSVGSSLTKSLTVPLVGAGTAMVAAASTYEDAIKQISAMTSASAKEAEAWGEQILKLAPKVSKGPQELAQALLTIASAGIKGKAAMELLEAAAKGSAAGLGSVADVAKVGISVLNAYGTANITGSQAMDILTKTADAANAEVATLAPVLGRILPIAAELGVKFADVGGAMAALTRISGDANSAATQLQGILAAMLDPSKEAGEALRAAGLSVEVLRQSIKDKGLLATLEMLKKQLKTNGKGLEAFFGDIEGLSGALQLVGDNATGVAETFGSVANNTGALGVAFKETDSFSRSLATLWSNLSVLAISMGQTIIPMLQVAVTKLNEVLVMANEFWNGLSTNAQEAIVIFLAMVAAIGPVVIAVGALVIGFGMLVGVIGGMIAFLTKGFFLIVGGLIAFIAAFSAESEAISPKLQELGMKMLTGFSNLAAKAIHMINPQLDIGGTAVREWLMAFASSTSTTLGELLTSVGAKMQELGVVVMAGIETVIGSPVQDALDQLFDAMLAEWDAFPETITALMHEAGQGLSAALAQLGQTLASWAQSAADAIAGVFRSMAQSIWDGIKSAGNAIANIGKGGGAPPGKGNAAIAGPARVRSGFSSAGNMASAARSSMSSFGASPVAAPRGMSGGAAQRGTSDITQTINLEVDGRAMAKAVVKNMPSVIGASTGFRGAY